MAPSPFRIVVSLAPYMPTMDPYDVDDVDEARDALCDELDRTGDAHEDISDGDLARAKDFVRAWDGTSPVCVGLAGYAHEAVVPPDEIHG